MRVARLGKERGVSSGSRASVVEVADDQLSDHVAEVVVVGTAIADWLGGGQTAPISARRS